MPPEKLTHETLYSLEQYSRIRPEFRARVMAHKKMRKVSLGEHVTLLFEDRLTMQYQVQEMLRLERMFEAELIQEELDVYNPLIPDGGNWKATMMIEYPDMDERQCRLAELAGIETRVWVQVDEFEPVYAIADEDLERTANGKTSAVHFLRFELSPSMRARLKQNGRLRMGIDHPNYQAQLAAVPEGVALALLTDLAD